MLLEYSSWKWADMTSVIYSSKPISASYLSRKTAQCKKTYLRISPYKFGMTSKSNFDGSLTIWNCWNNISYWREGLRRKIKKSSQQKFPKDASRIHVKENYLIATTYLIYTEKNCQGWSCTLPLILYNDLLIGVLHTTIINHLEKLLGLLQVARK